ncbi:lysophospholipid acyltransferase family protein [Terrisporobacter sp.]|uniref:lysophospholipid acyltransferase family protein n=1 Tax=Terrisporobacter sp. TaxID=1965305 RepID=UPI003FCDFC13
MCLSFYKFILNILTLYSKVFYKYEVVGEENIPTEGNIILAANHKSNLDPIFVASAIKNRKVATIAKKELFDNKILASILNKMYVIPIDRDNPGISTIKVILKKIKEGFAIGIFPEGTRIKGNEFGEAKAGLALFAIKGKACVVPISIISNYKLFNKVTIYIDKPISFEEYYKKKLSTEDYEKLSQDVLEVIKDNYFKR